MVKVVNRVVVFVGRKVKPDELAVASLMGFKRDQMDVRKYANTSALIDGAKELVKFGKKIDLVVYLSSVPMSHENATTIRKHVGASGLLHLCREAPELLIAVEKNIATVQMAKNNRLRSLTEMFALRASVGGWPQDLIAG